jgi:hypothetical protein
VTPDRAAFLASLTAPRVEMPAQGRVQGAPPPLPTAGAPDSINPQSVSLDAARVVVRAELDLYHAQHGHPRPVTICDLNSGYDAARRAGGRRSPRARGRA